DISFTIFSVNSIFSAWRDRTPKLTWHPDIMKAYEKRRIRSDNDYLFIKKDIPSKYLETLDEEDRKLNAAGLMSMFRDVAKRMGMESDKGQWQYFRAHNLRKYFNSTLLNNGCDLFMVDFLMGHQIDATRSAYFMADPERLRELYMRYIPFLSIESVETRVLTSESYEKLVTENQDIKQELEELRAEINARTPKDDLMSALIRDKDIQEVMAKKIVELGLIK
ncbi:tyrosine-type recombinase/integrase, partial [Halobacteriota archaeon]